MLTYNYISNKDSQMDVSYTQLNNSIFCDKGSALCSIDRGGDSRREGGSEAGARDLWLHQPGKAQVRGDRDPGGGRGPADDTGQYQRLHPPPRQLSRGHLYDGLILRRCMVPHDATEWHIYYNKGRYKGTVMYMYCVKDVIMYRHSVCACNYVDFNVVFHFFT